AQRTVAYSPPHSQLYPGFYALSMFLASRRTIMGRRSFGEWLVVSLAGSTAHPSSAASHSRSDNLACFVSALTTGSHVSPARRPRLGGLCHHAGGGARAIQQAGHRDAA